MNNNSFVLESKSGEVLRFVHWTGNRIYIVRDNNTKRILFSESKKFVEKNKNEFELIGEADKKAIVKSPVAVGQVGWLRALPEKPRLANEFRPAKEEDQHVPIL